MTFTTATITIAGLQLDAAKDGLDVYYVLVPQMEKVLGWRKNQAREKLASESLKAALGNVIRLGKKKDNRGNSRGYVGVISAKDFLRVVGWQAQQGNNNALSLLIALATETLERRIDAALNVDTTEDTYEERTKAFYRELARASYIPELMTWNERHANYGAFTNAFKVALRLPLAPVDTYTVADMQRWSKGITAYNALRYEGAGHKYALAAVRRQQADV